MDRFPWLTNWKVALFFPSAKRVVACSKSCHHVRYKFAYQPLLPEIWFTLRVFGCRSFLTKIFPCKSSLRAICHRFLIITFIKTTSVITKESDQDEQRKLKNSRSGFQERPLFSLKNGKDSPRFNFKIDNLAVDRCYIDVYFRCLGL